MTIGTADAIESLTDRIKDFFHVLNVQHRDTITQLRVPTPIKIAHTSYADIHGCIGNGLDSPNPETIWECPMSVEAWLHRITVTSPQSHPMSPLQTGEVYLLGSSGQTITWLPQEGDIAPVQLLEGRQSAPHLSPGETLQVVADLLPLGTVLRFDLQIMLQTGISEYTPISNAPGRVEQKGMF